MLTFTRRILFFCLLTILTQIGGFVYLLNFSSYKFIRQKFRKVWLQKVMQCLSFIVLYSIATLLIVPLLAKPFGRVPLPYTHTRHLQPLNLLTCVLNRHYVRPELEQAVYAAAEGMNQKYPGTITNYLDANFPFFNGFPLVPHLSHNDGKKLDLAFCYNDNYTGMPSNNAPSFIGYGICEEPGAGEENTASFCAGKGYWQYSLLRYIVPQGNKRNYSFNAEKTSELVKQFLTQPGIGKVFIEPYLKARMQLNNPKIRFHGCKAVRHDDHLHVQLN